MDSSFTFSDDEEEVPKRAVKKKESKSNLDDELAKELGLDMNEMTTQKERVDTFEDGDDILDGLLGGPKTTPKLTRKSSIDAMFNISDDDMEVKEKNKKMDEKTSKRSPSPLPREETIPIVVQKVPTMDVLKTNEGPVGGRRRRRASQERSASPPPEEKVFSKNGANAASSSTISWLSSDPAPAPSKIEVQKDSNKEELVQEKDSSAESLKKTERRPSISRRSSIESQPVVESQPAIETKPSIDGKPLMEKLFSEKQTTEEPMINMKTSSNTFPAFLQNTPKSVPSTISAQEVSNVEDTQVSAAMQAKLNELEQTNKDMELQLKLAEEKLEVNTMANSNALSELEAKMAKAEVKFENMLSQQNAIHKQELESTKETQELLQVEMKKGYEKEMASMNVRMVENGNLQEIVSEVRAASAYIQEMKAFVSQSQTDREDARVFEEETRMKLLSTMEDTCRSYTAKAQDECARLNGVLAVMESTMVALRGFNSEEKDRMRMEQLRLDEMSSFLKVEMEENRKSLEKERESLHLQRMHFERDKQCIEERMKKRAEVIDADRRELDAQRVAFNMNLQEFQSKEAIQSDRLRENELQLQRDRERLRQDQEVFEHKIRAHGSKSRDLEAKRRTINERFYEVDAEKTRLTEMASEMQKVSQRISDREMRIANEKKEADIALQQAQSIQKLTGRDNNQLSNLKQDLVLEQQKLEAARLQLAKDRGLFLEQKKHLSHIALMESRKQQSRITTSLKQQHYDIQQAETFKHEPVAKSTNYNPVPHEATDPTGLSQTFRNDLESWWTNDRFNIPIMQSKYQSPNINVQSPKKSKQSIKRPPSSTTSLRL